MKSALLSAACPKGSYTEYFGSNSVPLKGRYRDISEHIGVYRGMQGLGLRVHLLNIWVLASWSIVLLIQALGKYMMIGYLDPLG